MLHFKFPLKTGSKRAIQKTVEARGDLMDNKIADKIARTTSWSTPETTSQTLENSLEIRKKMHTSPEKDNKLLINLDQYSI